MQSVCSAKAPHNCSTVADTNDYQAIRIMHFSKGAISATYPLCTKIVSSNVACISANKTKIFSTTMKTTKQISYKFLFSFYFKSNLSLTLLCPNSNKKMRVKVLVQKGNLCETNKMLGHKGHNNIPI